MGVRELGVELAAGGVLWREGDPHDELAVVHRDRYDDWSLPKGTFDPRVDEAWADAAVREAREETGCAVDLGTFVDSTTYLVDDTPKVVLFWNMRLVEEAVSEPDDEVDELRWLSVPDALDLLDYADQRRLVALAAGRSPPVDCRVGPVRRHAWRRVRSSSLWPRGASHARLSGLLPTYRTELSHLIARVRRDRGDGTSGMPGTLPWAEAACSLLDDARLALDENDADRAWRCFLAATRLELFGLEELGRDALHARARSIAHEAEDKLDSWRAAAVADHLGPADEPKDDVTADAVYEAALVLHAHFNNQYYKLGVLKRQSSILALVAFLTTLLFLVLYGLAGPFFGPDVAMTGGPFVLAVALFGVVGASVSGFLALARAGTRERIPTQIASSWMALARPTIGAAAALVLFAFLQSGLLQVGEPTPGLALVVAFAAGSSERLLDRAVRSVEGG
jgi:8-oxo-dGTP diphosphatase